MANPGNPHTNKEIKYKEIYDDLCGKILNGVYKPGQKLPTENELARHFNTSRPTVGRAMRDLQQKGFIYRRQGQGTFVRQPHHTGNKTFGILIHWQNTPGQVQTMSSIFGLMVPEISRYASLFGYSLLLNDIPPEPEYDPVKRAQLIAQQLIDVKIAGVFFTPLELPDELCYINDEITSALTRAGIAVVLLDRDINNTYHRSQYDLVGINNERAAIAVTDHLIEQGCSKIDFLAESTKTTAIQERVKGYEIALECASLADSDYMVHYITSKDLFKKDPQYLKQAELILDRIKNKQVEAFVCVNDSTAADLLNFLLRSNIRVPDDVRIVGFDDLPLNDYLAVPLTTVRQPIEALAYEAVRTMIDRIEYPELPARDIMVHTNLVVRRSSGAGNPETA